VSTYPGKTDLLMVWVDMEIKHAKATGENEGVRALLSRKLCVGGPSGAGGGKAMGMGMGRVKVKPKVARLLFKKWLDWEEKYGDESGVDKVKQMAAEFAGEVKRAKEKEDGAERVIGERRKYLIQETVE